MDSLVTDTGLRPTVKSSTRLRNAWHSRMTFGLSVGLLGVAAIVALIAIIASLVGGSGGTVTQPSSRPFTPNVATTTDRDMTVPVAPFPVDWEVFQTVPFPVGGMKYGPTVHGLDGLVAGWAHTPRGAVLAALNIDSRVLLAPDGQWQTLLDRTILPGPGRDVLASYKRQMTGQIVTPEGGFQQLAGFKVISYDSAVAVIAIAGQRYPTDNIQVTTTTIRWQDSDWKLELQPDGSESPYATTIPDLASAHFVPMWAPR